jgi:predicted ATPase with chaperone activity
VLFLDELPESGLQVLQVMRQVLEDKGGAIRHDTVTFPAHFMLVSVMHPAPAATKAAR